MLSSVTETKFGTPTIKSRIAVYNISKNLLYLLYYLLNRLTS